MASTALVFMMVPGIALFYSGLRSQTTALSLIWLSMMAVSVVSIQVSSPIEAMEIQLERN